MKRIFVAVDISNRARRQAADYIQSFRNEFRGVRVGWEKPEKLHLTLKFLGATSEAQLTELNRIVAGISSVTPGFTFQLSETGVFPDARAPRVLWIDVKDAAGNLRKINELLETECERIGFKKDGRKFVPHLTIGRVREPIGARELASKHRESDFKPVETAVSEIVIYESRRLPAGSVYSVVSKHKLK